MSRSEEIQRWHRQYRMETGIKEVDLREFAAWMVQKGWPEPKPVSPLDQLTKQCSAALREETRNDRETGEPYRANHYYTVTRDGENYRLWVDIDEAPRKPMHTALTMRREQSVGDVTQMTRDADHWNRINPEEEPIVLELDFTLDVEIRRSTPAEA
jgi:hypothetical protein